MFPDLYIPDAGVYHIRVDLYSIERFGAGRQPRVVEVFVQKVDMLPEKDLGRDIFSTEINLEKNRRWSPRTYGFT